MMIVNNLIGFSKQMKSQFNWHQICIIDPEVRCSIPLSLTLHIKKKKKKANENYVIGLV